MYCTQNICSFMYSAFLGNVVCSDKYLENYTWDVHRNASKSLCKKPVLNKVVMWDTS